MIRKCKHCNKDFLVTKSNIYLCSSECKLIRERESQKRWAIKNKEYRVHYREKQKLKLKENYKLYYQKNKEKLDKNNKLYVEKNKEKVKEYQRLYYQNNKEKMNKNNKLYVIKNRDRQRIIRRKYLSNKKNNDFDYKIKMRLKQRLREVLNLYQKTNTISKPFMEVNFEKIIQSLKPLPKELKHYHIHHKEPLSLFTFGNPDNTINYDQIQLAFQPNNLVLITEEEHKKTKSYGKNQRKV